MAIIKNLWMRNAKKRLAGAVLYHLKTQTIVRELAASVTNVRSLSQMRQRTQLSNLVSVWKNMAFWAKSGAFESKKTTMSDYNAFVQANMNRFPVYLSKSMAENGAAVIAPYIISKGSLLPVTTTFDANNEYFASDINLGTSEPTGSETMGDIYQRIIDNNNGIKNGDQISYIQVVQTTINEVPRIVVRAYEFTIDVTSTEPYDASDFDAVFKLRNATGTAQYFLVHIPTNSAEGGAFIISRKSGGKLLVSPASLVLNRSAGLYYTTYGSLAAMMTAVNSYGSSGQDFLVPGESIQQDENLPINISLLSVRVESTTLTPGFSSTTLPSAAAVVFNFSSLIPEGTTVTSGAINTANSSIALTNGVVSGSSIAFNVTSSGYPVINSFTITLSNGNTYTLQGASGGGNADPGDVTP